MLLIKFQILVKLANMTEVGCPTRVCEVPAAIVAARRVGGPGPDHAGGKGALFGCSKMGYGHPAWRT